MSNIRTSINKTLVPAFSIFNRAAGIFQNYETHLQLAQANHQWKKVRYLTGSGPTQQQIVGKALQEAQRYLNTAKQALDPRTTHTSPPSLHDSYLEQSWKEVAEAARTSASLLYDQVRYSRYSRHAAQVSNEQPGATYTVERGVGQDEYCPQMAALATTFNCVVTTEINGYFLYARPGDSGAEVLYRLHSFFRDKSPDEAALEHKAGALQDLAYNGDQLVIALNLVYRHGAGAVRGMSFDQVTKNNVVWAVENIFHIDNAREFLTANLQDETHESAPARRREILLSNVEYAADKYGVASQQLLWRAAAAGFNVPGSK